MGMSMHTTQVCNVPRETLGKIGSNNMIKEPDIDTALKQELTDKYGQKDYLQRTSEQVAFYDGQIANYKLNILQEESGQKAKDRELALRLLSTLTSYSEPNALSSVFREQVINLCKTQL